MHGPVINVPLPGGSTVDYEAIYREGVVDRLDKLDMRLDEVHTLLSERLAEFNRQVGDLRVQLSVVEAVLRIKAGIWGASSGLAAGLMLVLIFLLTKFTK